MKYIELTQCKRAFVDDADYIYLMQWKWRYGSDGYACREQHLGMHNGKAVRRTILMHRLLLSAPSGKEVDHINHDRLDNRRSNLRLATRSQNMANKNSIKRKQVELPMGITYNPSPRTKQPYMARLGHNGKSYFLGNFYTVEAAAKAYREKKLELFGEFAFNNKKG